MDRRTAKKLVWVFWAVALAALSLFGAFVVLNWSTETVTPRPHGTSGAFQLLAWALMYLTFLTVGSLIVTRLPGNAIGWIFCWFGLSGLLTLVCQEYVLYGAITDPGALPGVASVAWLESLLTEPLLFLELTLVFLLFPDGRLPSPRWRVVLYTAIGAAVVLGLTMFSPGELTYYSLEDDVQFENPYGIPGTAALFDVLSAAGWFLAPVALIASVVAIVLRFRRARGLERLQLKWFAFAGVLALGVWGLTPVLSGLLSIPEEVWNVLVLPAFAAMPLAAGVAILRHNLYDIDRIINRALVYSALTVSLAACYVGVVVLANVLLFGAEGGTPDVVIAGATLAVAALFRPLRGRIQRGVDRRFYRRKYDAARLVDAFSARLRDQIDLDTVTTELRVAIHEAMQPAHVSLWLRAPARAGGRGAER